MATSSEFGQVDMNIGTNGDNGWSTTWKIRNSFDYLFLPEATAQEVDDDKP